MKLLVLQHIACEHPGIFRRFFAEDGIDWRAVELDAGEPLPALEDFDMLWAMGGPMDVWDVDDCPWLVAEKRAIRRFVRDLDRPFLGICLGHQLLADALNGTCGPMQVPEVGLMDVELTEAGRADPVLAGLASPLKVLQWHGIRVAQPPEDAVVLARSEACPVQAMRVGRRAYSTQFHVEIEPDTIPAWGCIPAYDQALAKVKGKGALAALAHEAAPLMDGFIATARRLYQNFMLHCR